MTVAWETIRLYWDWDRDGDFSEDSENISTYRRAGYWYAGCEGSPITSLDQAGRLQFNLDNSTGVFSKGNVASAYYGYIKPGGLVRLTSQIGEGAETTLWQGDLEDISAQPAERKVDAIAILTAQGVIGRTVGVDIEVAMSTNTATGALITSILNAASFPAGDRTIDTGQSTIGRHWVPKGTDALQAIRDLENTEFGRVRESKDGKLCWEDRAHRSGSPHNAVVATYTNSTAGTIRHMSCLPIDTRASIFNQFRANVRVFDISEDVILWTLSGNPPAIAAGATLTLEARLPEGSSYLAINSWTTIDLEAKTAASGGTDITSDVAVVQTKYGDRQIFAITNNNAVTAYVTILNAHGTAIVEGDPIAVTDEDQTSIDDFKPRPYNVTAPLITDVVEGQGWCAHGKALYKDHHQGWILKLDANANADHLAEAQRVNLSDRIHVHADASTTLYVDGDFWIERMLHTLDEQGRHLVELLIAEVVEDTWAATGTAYTPIVKTAIPDDLEVSSIDPSLHCVFRAQPWKYKENITGAGFRAKYFATEQSAPVDLRTVAEGGTLVHDGTNEWAIDDLVANIFGAEYELDAPAAGYIYYAFQFQSTAGDSVWSDGNRTPHHVEHFLPTDQTASAGPPSDWWVEVEADAVNHRVRVKASRPKTNGDKIWSWCGQIKDNRTGQWKSVAYDWSGSGYEPTDAYNIRYGDLLDSNDGDIGHAVSNDNRRFTRESGTGLTGYHYPAGGDYLRVGDLVLFDPTGGAWTEESCQWGIVDSIQGLKSGFNVATATYFDIQNRLRNTRTVAQTDLRLIAVDPPWTWTGEGFFGAQPNKGWFEENFWKGTQHGDKTTEIFIGPWMDVPSAVPLANIEARVWFDNGYSVSDNGVTTGGIIEDTGNPSGASGLVVLTHDDDPTIPEGMVAFQFSRDTVNYKGIYAVAIWLSTSLPAEGPYAAERAKYSPPTTVLETGTCVVRRGNKAIACTRPSPPAADVEGRVLLIYTDDASPDSDLDGNIIESDEGTTIVVDTPFNKSGSFSYAIVKRWWDRSGMYDSPPTNDTTNLAYLQFTPLQCAGSLEQAVWRTPIVSAPAGAFYATLCTRNDFGLGTRLTSAQASAGGGCVELTVVSGEVDTDLDLGRKFRFATGGGAVQINNPTGTVKCGHAFLYVITGAGAITVDTKFNLRGATLTRSASGRDYLGCIYNAEDDKYDCWWSQDA
jgi:hypothetical protein